jgi:hypothetical protein
MLYLHFLFATAQLKQILNGWITHHPREILTAMNIQISWDDAILTPQQNFMALSCNLGR